MERTQEEGEVLTVGSLFFPGQVTCCLGGTSVVTGPFFMFKDDETGTLMTGLHDSLKMLPQSIDGCALIYPFLSQPSVPPKAASER